MKKKVWSYGPKILSSAPVTSALLKKFAHFAPPHLVWWSAGAEERRCAKKCGSVQLWKLPIHLLGQ